MTVEAIESFRKVAMTLVDVAGDVRPASFVFTSAARREGTTTAVVNVARQLSATGKRTLVIEYNVQWPCLRKMFGLKADRALQRIGSDELGAIDAVQPSGAGFDVIASDTPRRGDDGAVGAGVLQAVLTELSRQYDITLLDTPPILLHADALAAAKRVPRVVLVVEAGRTRYEVLDRVRQELSGEGARVIGTVLNKHKRYIPGWVYKSLVQ